MALLKSNSRVLANTEKHLPVRQFADKEYLKNANKMVVKSNLKHKVKEFKCGRLCLLSEFLALIRLPLTQTDWHA